MKTLLPLGSVVMLEEGQKKLMVYGRIQNEKETGKTYDYIGCFYPEGVLNTDTVLLFNHEDIERVYFVGYQEEEEFAFQDIIRNYFDRQTAEE